MEFGEERWRLVKVNSLAVAERWLGQMKDTYHSSHHKNIGIWEYKNTETI